MGYPIGYVEKLLSIIDKLTDGEEPLDKDWKFIEKTRDEIRLIKKAGKQ